MLVGFSPGVRSSRAAYEDRLRDLFGNVESATSYGMTETFGVGGQVCSAGHLHFHPAHGLIEVVDRKRIDQSGPMEWGH